MRNSILFFIVSLLLLSGCATSQPRSVTQLDHVTKLETTDGVKHYRAYFKRHHLKSIYRGKRYLYLYNKKHKDLAILLHRDTSYLLYSLYHPHKLIAKMKGTRKSRYRDVKAWFTRQGYHTINPKKVGAIVSTSLRRYQGTKTLKVDVKDYRSLVKRYQKAISRYESRRIEKIQTPLPYSLISSYYTHYKKYARSTKQRKEIRKIGRKLHQRNTSRTSNKTKKRSKSTPKSSKSPQKKSHKTVQKPLTPTPKVTTKEKKTVQSTPFHHYMTQASYSELGAYLANKKSKNHLSYNQYQKLQKRYASLKHQHILRYGSLEALIAEYKKSHDPRIKTRILQKLKEAQKKSR